MNRDRWAFYIRRAIWIFIVWVVFAIGVFLYDYFTLQIKVSQDFKSAFTAYLLVAICGGIIGGTLTVNLMEYWLRKYRFWVALLLIIFVYTLVAFLIGSIGHLYMKSTELGVSPFHRDVIRELPGFFGKAIFVKNYVIWLVLIVLTLIFLMVNDRFGRGVLANYLTGRYFHPKKEQRIFMFSDIKDATTIAENLGEEAYFHFLKDFFKCISPAITACKGEIYQYVGDEIVVTWRVKSPSFNQKSLLCYDRMNELLQMKASYFQKEYGSLPKFKSGYHCGSTVVGEIGITKRDIVFSGDVLNTAARIQGKCNDLEVRVLASEAFITCLGPNFTGKTIVPMGAQHLKGKQQKVALFTFRNEN